MILYTNIQYILSLSILVVCKLLVVLECRIDDDANIIMKKKDEEENQ